MDAEYVDLLTSFLPYAGEQPITPESRLRDLGLDSMKAIDLFFAIEDVIGISLPDEYLNDATFATAGNLWQAIEATRLETTQGTVA